MVLCSLSPSLTTCLSELLEFEFEFDIFRFSLLLERPSPSSDTESKDSFIVAFIFSSNLSALPSSQSPLLVDLDFSIPTFEFP